MSTVCSECIEDPFLAEIAVEEGGELECSLCRLTKESVLTAKQLGELLEPLLRERLEWGGEMRVFSGPDDDKGGWEQQGDPIELFVSEFLAQDFDFLEEIVAAVIDAENCWPPDGDQPFFDTCANYERATIHTHEYSGLWQSATRELQSRRRFFSAEAKNLFDAIFGGLRSVQVLVSIWNPESDGDARRVVREFAVGASIYRARTLSSDAQLEDIFKDPFRHVGPPPSGMAKAGRMNAEGVVVLYGAMESDTAIAELRPLIGGDTAVIGLRTTAKLRVLDFELLEKSFSDISEFDPSYKSKSAKQLFLRQLHYLISRPVLPGKEIEYLITQTMAEYLSHVMDEPVHGIIFKSVQREGGKNIVLFPDFDGNFPVEYLQKSLSVFQTVAVEHKNTERLLYEFEGKIHLSNYDPDQF